MNHTRHVPVGKADRPKRKNHTRKHRAANKRRLEQERGYLAPRPPRKRDVAE